MIYQPVVSDIGVWHAIFLEPFQHIVLSFGYTVRYVTFAAAREDLCQHGRMPQVTGGMSEVDLFGMVKVTRNQR